MGRAGARRVLWGLAVVGAVLVPTAASGSTAAPAETIDGAVLADGTPQGAPGRWMVSHPAPGVYRIVTGEPRLTLDVPRWDVVADVTILLLNLSLSLDIDLSDAIAVKMRKNAVKYPPGQTGV